MIGRDKNKRIAIFALRAAACALPLLALPCSCLQGIPAAGILEITEGIYSLTVNDGVNGTVTVEPEKELYAENETVRLTAAPAAGYVFCGWNGDVDDGESAAMEIVMNGNKSVGADFSARGWTHLVYMAADNDLDDEALNDLNEMEAADTGGKAMTILALVDRKAGNGDWPDTRLYEIAHDPGGNSASIVSSRLASPELGLSADVPGELDLSDPVTLERFIAYAVRAYPAARYSLTVWGHGTGWRGDGDASTDGSIPMKAVAVDETSGSYMTIALLGEALRDRGISVIGFDTCFGALLEVAYELRDAGEYLVGSEGPTKDSGWDYATLFSSVDGSTTATSLADAVADQFKAGYAGTANATVSVIRLAEMGALQADFDSWATALAMRIDAAEKRDALRSALFDSSRIDAFWYPGTSSDYYVDVSSLVSLANETIDDDGLIAASAELLETLDGAVPRTWSDEYAESARQIGVFLIGVNDSKVPASTHSPAYTQGSGADCGAFVNDTGGWVPNADPDAVSALNRIFYSVF